MHADRGLADLRSPVGGGGCCGARQEAADLRSLVGGGGCCGAWREENAIPSSVCCCILLSSCPIRELGTPLDSSWQHLCGAGTGGPGAAKANTAYRKTPAKYKARHEEEGQPATPARRRSNPHAHNITRPQTDTALNRNPATLAHRNDPAKHFAER
jgi:hypothetical protein